MAAITADRFMTEHVEAKRKAGTAEFYRDILDRIVKPAVSTTKADKLTRLGSCVVPGDDPKQPRHDLKRPWDAVTQRADLIGVRLHDLRHTYASFGAGGGLGPRARSGGDHSSLCAS
jgi:integrase